MEENKFCAVCGKQIEKYWVGGQVQDKNVLFCSNCAIEILIQQNWILEKENQALKDRWELLKNWIANTKPLRGTNIYFLQETLLDKIEELEKE